MRSTKPLARFAPGRASRPFPAATVLAALLAAAFLLSLSGCSTLLSALSPGNFLGGLRGAVASAASNPEDLDRLVAAGKAIGKAAEEVTPEEEYYIGRAVAATVLAKYRPWEGKGANDYVNRLGQVLALASDLPETYGGYHFLVLDSADINAFGAPGGLILVSRGLLHCASTEDEVAAILAHEIGHVSLKHGLSAIKTARWTDAALKIASYAAANSGSSELRDLTASFGDVIGDIVSTMVNSGYSQELEKQADLAAVRILHDVGYDPEALVRVLEAMKARISPEAHDFSSTHPSPELRIAYIKAAVALLPPADGPRPTASELEKRRARYLAALAGL